MLPNIIDLIPDLSRTVPQKEAPMEDRFAELTRQVAEQAEAPSYHHRIPPELAREVIEQIRRSAAPAPRRLEAPTLPEK